MPHYPSGLSLIQAGRCPAGAILPMACWTCTLGHATECHFPFTCDEANCGHYQADCAADAEPDYDGEEAAAAEAERQARIAAGAEHVCAGCGCSESKACPGGCIWVTPNLCSRCVGLERALVV